MPAGMAGRWACGSCGRRWPVQIGRCSRRADPRERRDAGETCRRPFMTSHAVLVAAALLFAVGMWLMLPGGRLQGRLTEIAMAVAGCGLFGLADRVAGGLGQQRPVRDPALRNRRRSAAAISLRNPLYCELVRDVPGGTGRACFSFKAPSFSPWPRSWFTPGQSWSRFCSCSCWPRPRAGRYDRVSWDALVSAFCGAIITGVLTVTIAAAIRSPEFHRPALSPPPIASNILSPQHTARIGGELFGHYLIAVEAGGVLLLAALVGAAVIVGQSRGPLGVPLDRSLPATPGVPRAACPPVSAPHGQQAARGTPEIGGDGHV